MNSPAGSSTNRKNLIRLILILLLIAAIYGVFSPLMHCGFINLDDGIYVTRNPYVRDGLSLKGLIWAFSAKNEAGFWFPLTWLSLMLDAQVYGLHAGGFHLTNLLLHILNALLLFLILEHMTGALWESAFVAFLFALHPLRVESVAWVTERKDMLSTLFFLLAIGAYARYVKDARLTKYLPVFLFFSLGCMAKPMVVTLPFILLLLDYWPFSRFRPGMSCIAGDTCAGDASCTTDIANNHAGTRWQWLVLEKIPLFLLSAATSLTALLSQKRGGVLASLDARPLSMRIANALMAYVRYIGKMVWPRYLAIFYPHQGMPHAGCIAAAFLFLTVVSLLVIRMRPHPYCLVGWLWYLGTLLPVIGLIQAGSQAMADRFTYLPLIGLFIMIAWGIPHLAGRTRLGKPVLALLSGGVLLALIVCTRIQLGYWKDNIALFEHALEVTKDNWLIQNNLGYTLMGEGKVQEAIMHYQEALAIKPNYVHAHYNLGNALMYSGKVEEGMSHFREAIKILPDYEEAHNNLGSLLAQQGRVAEAIGHYREALRINPQFVRAHYNLGLALAGEGNYREAAARFQDALQIMPRHAMAHCALGMAYVGMGDTRAALEQYRILRALDARMADELFNAIFSGGGEQGIPVPQ